MTHTPIVNQFIPIAERLAQIEHERRVAKFALPEGVKVLIRAEVTHRTELPPRCPLCFLLDEALGSMVVIGQASRETLFTRVGREFVAFMTETFPTLRVMGDRELILSSREIRELASQIRKTRG